MDHVTTGRRLVKSPPELWAELSDPESLARRLGELGEIRITRTLPETTVAWEAERASGIVEIESSGWGTRVSLSASPTAAPEPEPPPAPPPAPLPPPARVETKVRIVAEEERRIEIPLAPPEPAEPVEPPTAARPLALEAEVESAPRSGLFGRLFRRRPAEPLAEPEPAPEPEPVPEPPPAEPPPPPEVLTLRIVHAVCATRVPERPPLAPAAPPPPPPAPDPDALHAEDLRAVLDRVLDDLGAAHHRPFSRG
jgi:hypothetical protein